MPLGVCADASSVSDPQQSRLLTVPHMVVTIPHMAVTIPHMAVAIPHMAADSAQGRR